MGQMKWMSPDGSENAAKVLHLREKEGDRWQPYSDSPSVSFAKVQALLKAGWQYVKVD